MACNIYPQAIEANDASKFRLFLVFLNLVTAAGTWFYAIIFLPEETVCTVQACDTLLEQSLSNR